MGSARRQRRWSFLLCPWAWSLSALVLVSVGGIGYRSWTGRALAGAASVLVFSSLALRRVELARAERLERMLTNVDADRSRDRTILSGIPGMVWRSGASSDRTFISPFWLATTGQTADEALHEGWLDAVHPKDRDRCRAAHRLSAARRSLYEIEYRIRRADNVDRWVRDRAAPCFNDDGVFCGYAGLTVEIERREDDASEADEQIGANETINTMAIALVDRYEDLDEARQRAEYGERVKSDFLAALSEELREPVEELVHATGLLQSPDLTDEQRALVERMQAAAGAVGVIRKRIKGLGAVGDEENTIEEGRFNLRRVLEQLVTRQQARAVERGVIVSCVVEDAIPSVIQTDPLRLRRIILEMLAAILRHAHDSRVALRVGRDPRFGDGLVLHFSLACSGDGLTPDLVDRALYPAETMDGEAAGLGLGTCKRLAESLGGRFGIQRDDGGATTFWFSLEVVDVNPSFDGRRAHGRLPQESLASNLGPVLDLSLGGMRVRSKTALEGRLEIELTDNEEMVRLEAEVAWTRRVGFGKHESGLRFLELADGTRTQLGRIATRNRLRRMLEAA